MLLPMPLTGTATWVFRCAYCDAVDEQTIQVLAGNLAPYPFIPQGWRSVEYQNVCPRHFVEIKDNICAFLSEEP